MFWQSISRKLIVLLAMVILMALASGTLLAIGEKPPADEPEPAAENLAPDFTLTTYDGEDIQLSDLRGKVVVLNFWASWCAPCEFEAPALQSLWEEYAEEDVMVIGVAYLDMEAATLDYIGEHDLTYPIGPDDSNIANDYGVLGIPETFIIDRDGVLVEHYTAPITGDILKSQVTALLDGDTTAVEIPNLAPDFSFTSYEDEEIRLSDYRGSVVLLNFWASWCPPCRDEAPDLQAVWENYRDRNVMMLGVVIWDENNLNIQAFIQNFGLTYPNGFGPEGIDSEYDIIGVPTNILINPDGTIYRRVNSVEERQLSRALDRMDGVLPPPDSRLPYPILTYRTALSVGEAINFWQDTDNGT